MKNMRTTQEDQSRHQHPSNSANRHLRTRHGGHRISALLLILAALFLFPERPAWGGEWIIETSNHTIDSENRAIFENTGSLSAFAAAVSSVSDNTGWNSGSLTSSGDGYSSGCFISASPPEMGGSLLLIGVCLASLIYGVRMVLRASIVRQEKK